jgi:hypothetical protein|uniref:Uncharacterized protein n=1 Tax=Leptospirillum ferrodiazotrophum TaxID=412449 RepID=C6I0V8_9BACT|nr:MAG: protein of unknown function [Leptospirillum ferrodiazotrophum]
MKKKLNPRDAFWGIVAGLLLFYGGDRLLGLTNGAFHHIFGAGILFSYLLAPLAISFVTGYIAGPFGKFLGPIPPMTYLLIAYLYEVYHPSGMAVGIPVAPFMMIFFITVPEVSFLGGYVGEVLRRRRSSRGTPSPVPKTRGPERIS